MSKTWFKRFGWSFLPVSWQGVAVVIAALAFCANVFWAMDRRSHSVSDTIYNIFPYFVCTFLLCDWIATRTCRD